MTVMGQTYTERKAAGEAVIKACMLMDDRKNRGFGRVSRLPHAAKV